MPSEPATIDDARPGESLGRKLYAFLAVALAVFMLTITVIGFACHGYAVPKSAATIPAEPRPDAAETSKALEQATGALDQARRKSAEALEAYEFANAALVEFVSANLKQLKSVESAEASAPADEPATNREARLPATVDSRWQDLHDQQQKLEDRRAELLVKLTPKHPSIRYIDLQLADLEAQLKLIPEPIASAAPEAAAKTVEAERKTVLLEWHKVDADYQRLRERQATARQAYDDAIAAEGSTRKLHDAAVARNLLAQGPAPEPQGDANPTKAILWGFVFATAVGCPIAFRARRPEAAFRSAAEVRQTLGLPVLGFLPRPAGEAPREQPLCEPTWVRRAVFSAEFFVAAVIVWLAVAAVLDHQFVLDLLVNPLAACSQKFWC